MKDWSSSSLVDESRFFYMGVPGYVSVRASVQYPSYKMS